MGCEYSQATPARLIVAPPGDDLFNPVVIEVGKAYIIEVARIPEFPLESSLRVEKSKLARPTRALNRDHDDFQLSVPVKILG